MKRSKWMVLNSLLAALAISAALVDLIDFTRQEVAIRPEPLGSGRNTPPGGTRARVGEASPPNARRRGPAPARLPDEATQGGSHGPLLSPEPAPSSTSPTGTDAMSPVEAATGLGWALLVAPPAQPPSEAAEILDTSWLALIGSVTQSDGRSFYFFKNEHTGAVMRLSPAQPIEGWTLELPEAGVYLIAKDGERYQVRRQ